MEIRWTSETERGQIYVPKVNLLLLLAVLLLVVMFRSSSSLAHAYGLAVTGTMVVTAVMAFFVDWRCWRWPFWASVAVIAPFLIVDRIFLAANALKIPHGGWMPLLVGALLVTLMMTWRRGTRILFDKTRKVDVALVDRRTSRAGWSCCAGWASSSTSWRHRSSFRGARSDRRPAGHAAVAGQALHQPRQDGERRHRLLPDPDRPRRRGRHPGHGLGRSEQKRGWNESHPVRRGLAAGDRRRRRSGEPAPHGPLSHLRRRQDQAARRAAFLARVQTDSLRVPELNRLFLAARGGVATAGGTPDVLGER